MTPLEQFVAEGSEKADGAMLIGGEMATIRVSTVQRKKSKSTRRCSTQPAFTDWKRDGKTVDNSSRSQKKWTCVEKSGRTEAPHRVVCGRKQIRLLQVRKDK